MKEVKDNMRWIDTTDLNNWSSRRDSQEYLPLLIRHLIRATVNGIDAISFPAGESIVYSGWDGRLESRDETEYIPKGLSLWELSTEKNVKSKAEKDYKKRKENPLITNPSETIFIFVTLRIWKDKVKWTEEKKRENFWRDVRAYDARDLEEWIEQVPAVGAWLARFIGKYPGNVLSFEDWWKEWSQITNPPLVPELVLAGRDKQINEVKKWLSSTPSILSVQALTKDESIAFLSAIILTLPEKGKEYFLSKFIVISDGEVFRQVITTCRNSLIIVANFEEIEIAKSYQNNHHIFVPLDFGNTVTEEKIVLPRLERDKFVSILQKMGISEEEANRLSRDTARSLSVLRRRLSKLKKQPEWATPERVREILSILLVGKWNENKLGDREIISEITGIEYNKYVSSLKSWLYKPDPPILKIGEIWRLTSPLDAFFALSKFLTKDNFEKLKKVSIKVLREVDPSLDLEPEKRWMASVYGKEFQHSKTLREGIAQTLVLIGVFGDDVSLDLPCTSQSWVDNVVREMLSEANWKLWYSLHDVLPLIAEASPSSFLDAVEDSLSQNSPSIMGMFSETDDTLTSHSAHPSLLWALEGLAWDPNLLARVTLILGKLARLDPGGNLGNRPINSLRSIFLLWLPQTYASLRQKLVSIELLIEKEPEVGWTLLIDLLPRNNDVSHYNYKFHWRKFSEKNEYRITIKEHLESISAIVKNIIKNVGLNGNRWCQIIEHFYNLPSQERKKILCEFSKCISLIEEGGFDLWNKTRELLSRHRSFSDAEWALPEKELAEIEKIYNKLKPKDILKRFLWLFDDYWPHFPEGKVSDYKKQRQLIAKRRIKAAESIKAELGIDGVIKFAMLTKNPQIVGNSIAESHLTEDEGQILLSLLDAKNQKKITFVQGYIWQMSYKNKEVWIKKLVDTALSQYWSSEKIVNLFLALPQNRDNWKLLEKFDTEIQKKYWKKVQVTLFHLPLEDKIYTLKKLVNVKRYFTALYNAGMFAKELPSKLIVELLEKAAIEKSIDDFFINVNWSIEELFKALDQSNKIEKGGIAKLEWLYLPVLASLVSNRPPKVLHQELANNPEFFAEVIKHVYKPRNKDFDEDKDLKKQRAQLGWELLYTWKKVPGSDEEGKIDYQKLKSWVDRARELCKDLDRTEICDIHIGQVLANAIPDGNDNWPPEKVCKIIDEIRNEELDSGFAVGIKNKRGIVTKSPFEGGEQEWKLASKFKIYAGKITSKYPRTASILRKIAEEYENEAKREETEAEKRKLEW